MTRWRWLPALVLIVVPVVAGCSHSGHSSPNPGSQQPSSDSGIPQGNVGDNDSDNHGGPSDGDGNI